MYNKGKLSIVPYSETLPTINVYCNAPRLVPELGVRVERHCNEKDKVAIQQDEPRLGDLRIVCTTPAAREGG